MDTDAGAHGVRPLGAAERPLWAGVRARLASQHPALAGAVFRAVPVAHQHEPGQPLATADRWGRIYLDPATETTAGIAAVADAVRAAVLDWVSGQTDTAPWHASRLDDRFPAVAAAQTSHAGRAVASWLANTPSDAWRGDPFSRWREWAHRVAGPPQVSWRDEIGARVRGAVSTSQGYHTRTFTRLGRRQQPGLVTPAWRAPRLTIGVIADISGSLARDLPAVVVEVQRIVSAAGISASDVTLLEVDDDVAAEHTPPPPRLVLEPRDGHMTDLRAGFDRLARRPQRPDITIVLTDAITPWPQRAPHGQVIVVVIGEGTVVDNAARDVPPWARTLRITTLEEHPRR